MPGGIAWRTPWVWPDRGCSGNWRAGSCRGCRLFWRIAGARRKKRWGAGICPRGAKGAKRGHAGIYFWILGRNGAQAGAPAGSLLLDGWLLGWKGRRCRVPGGQRMGRGKEKRAACDFEAVWRADGRGGGIRTRGLLFPKQARCRTALLPDRYGVCRTISRAGQPGPEFCWLGGPGGT